MTTPSPSKRYKTYHCLCTSLLLATPTPLNNLPKRRRDGAVICHTSPATSPSSNSATATFGTAAQTVVPPDSTILSIDPLVLRLEDGFEKRWHLVCSRCELKVGYRLSTSAFSNVSPAGGEAGTPAQARAAEQRKVLEREEPEMGMLYLYPEGLVSTEDMVAKVDLTTRIEGAAGVGVGG